MSATDTKVTVVNKTDESFAVNVERNGVDESNKPAASLSFSPPSGSPRVGSTTFFEENSFAISEIVQYLSVRDLIMFLSSNKQIRKHIRAPEGEIARRKRRFREIKWEISKLLEPLPTPKSSLQNAQNLLVEARKMIGFGLLVHDIDTEQITSDNDNHVCPHCSQDPFFYEERIQLQPHSYRAIGEKSFMFPMQFYRLDVDDLDDDHAQLPETSENAVDTWMRELPALLPAITETTNIAIPNHYYSPFAFASTFCLSQLCPSHLAAIPFLTVEVMDVVTNRILGDEDEEIHVISPRCPPLCTRRTGANPRPSLPSNFYQQSN